MRVRSEHSKKNKWYLRKHQFMSALHYALQYQEWEDEYAALSNSVKGISYDGEKVQSSGGSNPTAEIAMRKEELSRKMDSIRRIATSIDTALAPYLIIGVTREGITYDYLRTVMGIPCGKNQYYDLRQHFYFELNKIIGE